MIELNGETYLDGNEACHLLGIKVSTLYTYVSRGVLKSYRQGIKRQRLYKRAEIEALLQLRPGNESLTPLPPEPSSSSDNQDDDSHDDQNGPDIPHAADWVPNV